MSNPTKTSGIRREEWSQTAEKAKEAASTAGDKVSEAGSSIGSIASNAASAVSAMACDVGKKAEDMLGSASHAISSTVRESGEYLGEAGFSGVTRDVAKLVRQNPIPSVCIAIGLGWLLARSLRN